MRRSPALAYWAPVLFILFIARSAAAQQRPIFDPDDFVDARQHGGAVFISSLVLGGVSGFVNDYRPLHQNAAVVSLANSLYWGHIQLDYKISDMSGKNNPANVCGCAGNPIYFPTPPSADSIPAASPPGLKHTTQVAGYYAVGGGPAEPPVMLRFRLSASWQAINTDVTSIATGETSRLSGRERSIGLDADTYFRIRGHDVWGSLIYARTVRTGTTDDRSQNELAYMSRFPGRALGPILVRATLTVGGVTGRGASGLNIVNPAFEAFWHSRRANVNLHLVWSPLAARSGADGWQNFHQIAFFVDRALYVKLFRPRKE
ncbi:MAG TPA: hypothetical protein VN380_19555 [Thermoanaerobaculia bacterium]|jgi:hypothetical protein|nr:hypothetical protein [Thermoanaerobaculia bacterium]